MGAGYRAADGGRIERAQPLPFTFNGRRLVGFAGDTLASALLANGVHRVSRSFKYHRPRGILSAGAEEPCALVQLEEGARTEPNLRATQIELYAGLSARGVNAWPSVAFDLGAINNRLSKLFVAGFYYKTFMWPPSFWRTLYEPVIRRMAGLGRAPEAPDPDLYDRMNARCDLLVVGGGPAGLAAAQAAARSGARVILADEQAEFGGGLLGASRTIAGEPGDAWVAEVVGELAAAEEVRMLPRTTVFGYYDHNQLAAFERRTDHLGPGAAAGRARQRIWHIDAAQVVLATGAHERPLVFADNDRPGIMLAGAVRTYIERYAAVPGRRAVVFTNNDGAYETALALGDAGAEVAAVVDLRARAGGPFAERVAERGIPVHHRSAIVATGGGARVAGVEVGALDGTVEVAGGAAQSIACDLLAVSGGWSPAVHLFSQSRGRLRYDEENACFVPGASVQAERSVGAAQGRFGLAQALGDGAQAGVAAARAAGFNAVDMAAPPVEAPPAGGIEAFWLVPGKRPLGHGPAKHFIDMQDDVTAADIRLAVREGFQSVEHVKRYTTVGMGTDQGKVSNLNALAILAGILGRPIPEVGTTTFRAPYTPVTFGALAGRDVGGFMDPARLTAIHAWHEDRGAVFENVGQWKRPYWYPKTGEDKQAAVNRECRAVRNRVGLLDASTLGKIDIRGPDAGEFLDRIYTNRFSTLPVGKVRYGLMCRDDGMIFDDGTTARLGEEHFLMTTTSGNAASVLDWLEEWLQTEWPELKVYCSSVTEQWATLALAGPRARDVLAALAPDVDLDDAAFPFMATREGEVGGMPARIARISFAGGLGFELNVPWDRGLALWQAVMAAGAPYDITPYGTEAMHVLRAESGFVIVGQETDGTVTPFDLGMDWIVSQKKPDFIGKRAYLRPDTARADRKQLVGLLTEKPLDVLPEGGQLVDRPHQPKPVPMIGHVTSSYYSANLDRSIALALVRGGRARLGETIYAPLKTGQVKAVITRPVFPAPGEAGGNG